MVWQQGRRRLYDRILDEPRLSRSFASGDAPPHPALHEVRAALGDHWTVAFGGTFLNYYRDGRDSVAWHADSEMPFLENTLVAIVTLGGARPFLLRPRAGGASRDLRPGSGDLIVMGGSAQRDWEHSVPKVASADPRISVSIRWSSRTGTRTRPTFSRFGSRRTGPDPSTRRRAPP